MPKAEFTPLLPEDADGDRSGGVHRGQKEGPKGEVVGAMTWAYI